MLSINEKLRAENDERNRKRYAQSFAQTDPEPMIVVEDEKEASLVCNIPEHHNLEDMVHQYQEQLTQLKAYLRELDDQANSTINDDSMAILEKRAEFEALDLAINQRKQQLINLEMSRNRRLNEDTDNSTSGNTMILKVRIIQTF